MFISPCIFYKSSEASTSIEEKQFSQQWAFPTGEKKLTVAENPESPAKNSREKSFRLDFYSQNTTL